MAIKLTNTDVTVQYVNMLVYGESGIGKTTLCGTAPSPLIISAEAGLMPLRGKNIDVFEVKTRKNVDEVYDWLKGSEEAAKYETVELDSLSEIAEVLLNDEKARTKDARQAYGVMAEELAVLVRGFRDLPMHVCFTAKQKKVVDEATGAITIMPSVPGKAMLDNLPYFFDEVFLLTLGKTKDREVYRYLSTSAGARHVAKDRSGLLLPQEKPDLTYIINKILEVNKPAKTEKESTNKNPIKPKT